MAMIIMALVALLNLLAATRARAWSGVDFSSIRGANYIPSAPAEVSWDFLAPAEKYDATVIAREVGWAKSVLNLNALRIRASPGAFAADPGTFSRNLQRFLAVAQANGIRVMPILFDTGDLLKPLLNASAVESYLAATVKTHAHTEAVMGWDMCNECYFPKGDKNTDSKRKALEEITVGARRLRGPRQFVTTGMGDFGRWPREAEQAQYVDIVSFHSYDGNQKDMSRSIDEVKALADKAGKPLAFASEISNRPWDPVCGDLAVLSKHKLGWFAWELMVSHSGWGVPKCEGCPVYQGLLWPQNGSAFSEEERHCILGDNAVTWLPLLQRSSSSSLSLPPPPPPPSPSAQVFSPQNASAGLLSFCLTPPEAWIPQDCGSPTAILPWTNPPCRGEGGMRLDQTSLIAETAAVARSFPLEGSERSCCGAGVEGAAALSLNFTGSAVAIYISSDKGSANATVMVDGEQLGALVGYSPKPRYARHIWLAQNLTSRRGRGGGGGGVLHQMVVRFSARGALNISGLDVWA